MTTRVAHPVAEIFPAMSDEDHRGLVEDIREHGLREPIWLHRDGRIVDGRNRYRACGIVGIEPRFRTYEGDDGSLLNFVVSLNLRRRHLTESQRAMVASRIANLASGQRADLAGAQICAPAGPGLFEAGTEAAQAGVSAPVSQAQASSLLSVSRRATQQAQKVIREGSPELVAEVESGGIAVSAAATIASAPPGEQREVLSLPRPERAKKVKEIDARRAAARKLDAAVDHAATAGLIPAEGKRRYDEAAERADRERRRGEIEADLDAAAKRAFGRYTADEFAAIADAHLVQSLRLFVNQAKLYLDRVERSANPSKPDPSQRPQLRVV